MTPPRRIKWSLFKGARDNRAEPCEGTFEDLCADILDGEDYRGGKDGPAFAPVTFGETEGIERRYRGQRARWRRKDNVESASGFALDVEGNTTKDPRKLLEPLRRAGLEVFAYSTWSDGDAAKAAEAGLPAEGYRFRVVGYYTRDVTSREHAAILEHLADLLDVGAGVPIVDRKALDVARLSFTWRPANPASARAPWKMHARGAALDPDNLPGGASLSVLMAERKAAGLERETLTDEERAERRAAWQAEREADPRRFKGHQRRAASEVEAAILAVAEAPDGERNNRLFRGACVIGSWGAAGVLSSADVDHMRRDLLDAAMRIGLERREAGATIGSGLRTGARTPRPVQRRSRFATVARGDDVVGDLCSARARLKQEVRGAMGLDGAPPYDALLDVGTGVGKSTTVLDAVAETPGLRARLAYPTNDLMREQMRCLRKTASRRNLSVLVEEEPKRTAETCHKYAAFVAAGALERGANRELCALCELHPRNNDDGEMRCGFFAQMEKTRSAHLVFTTHALLVQQGEIERVIIDDNATREALRDDVPRVRPTARLQRGEGDGRDLVLSVEASTGEGTYLPPDIDDVSGAERQEAWREWFAEVGRAPCYSDDESLIAKWAPEAPEAPDLLFIDESPRGAMLPTHRLSAAALRAYAAHDDVTGDGVAALLELVTRSETLKDTGRPPCFGPSVLAEHAPPGSLVVDREAGRAVNRAGKVEWERQRDTLCNATSKAAVKGLGLACDVEALEALDVAAQRGWVGCYVRSGELHIRTPRTIERRDVRRSTILADGTATRETATVLLGPSFKHVRIRARTKPGSELVHVPLSLGPRDMRGGHLPRKKRQTVEALARRYDTPRTLWVMHKRWLEGDEDGPVWLRELLADAIKDGRVTHFGAAAARGSNDFIDCDTVVLLSWHLPAYAIDSEAQVLEHLAGEVLTGVGRVDWREQARYQMETATVVQALDRVRLVDKPARIVVADARDPGELAGELVGLPEPTLTLPEELALGELGLVEDNRTGTALWVRREVEAQGFIAISGATSTGGELQRLAANHYRRDYPALARAAGCELGYARTSRGGDPTPVLFGAQAPDVAAVAACLPPGAAWVEWQGERLRLDGGAEGQRAAIEGALRSLPAAEAVTWEALSGVLGCSPSTARRRSREAGLGTLDALRARWGALYVPPPKRLRSSTGGGWLALSDGLAWEILDRMAQPERGRAEPDGPPPHEDDEAA